MKRKKESNRNRKIVKEDDLGAFVYGAIDGIVTTFAIVAAAAGASLSTNIVLILGFANLFADGFSMAASNYLSSKSIKQIKENYNEHHQQEPLRSAIITFLSFNVVGFVPLISFVFFFFATPKSNEAFGWAVVLAAIAFIIVGSIKAKVTKQSWITSSMETLFIGGIAALISYLVGQLIATII